MPEKVIEDLAERLLRKHAESPHSIWYAAEVLPGSYTDEDLKRLDEAYDYLHGKQWMEWSGAAMSFFGSPKLLYKITSDGIKHAGVAA